MTARPDQESADLGGLLYAFRRAGAGLALLCLTRGEASPLNSAWNAGTQATRLFRRGVMDAGRVARADPAAFG